MKAFSGTDRYEIERRLGSGGMGVVYEAHDRERNERVALKTLFVDDPRAIYRLKREFRTLADVAHPNLITFYELVREGDTWFITMELIEGTTFFEHVRPATSAAVHEGPPEEVHRELDLGRLRTALAQLAAGVHHLHQVGRWHRDIKPGNVLVTSEGRVVLLDFGISAEWKEKGPATVVTGALGTIYYMAPEQVEGGESAPASDWYAVGVMLYEALVGKLPFAGTLMEVIGNKLLKDPEPPIGINPNLPADLSALAMDLMARDPAKRPDGSDVLHRLGRPPTVESLIPVIRTDLSAILGREPHLAVLSRAFRRMREGEAISVYAHGVSGIGKTTLVAHFLRQIDRKHKSVILSGRCYPRESMPYKAVDGVIDSLTRYLRSLPKEHAIDLMPRDTLFLARVFPVLLQVGEDLDLLFPRPKVPDALEVRKRAFSALRELLGAIARNHPLILSIDDLQWADIDSIALLEELMKPPAAPPLLLISCFRGEEIDEHPVLSALVSNRDPDTSYDLRLGPLDEAEATALVRSHLESADSEPLVRSIVREAAGSPFVLEQLARHVMESDEQEMANVTLAVMLDAAIARSPPGTRELMETLAVAVHPVDFEVAHNAAAIEGGARALVASLEVAHLIRRSATADRIELYHDQIREALTERLEPDQKKHIHLSLAHAIRVRGIDDPEALFEHYLGADRKEQAAEQAVKAGLHAVEALAFDRAARFLRRAIELTPPEAPEMRVRLLKVNLGEALANAGRPAEAADAFLEASEGREPAAALELKRRAAEQLLFGGHSDRGLQVTRDLLRSAGLRMAPNRRRAVLGIMQRLARLRLRGLRFVERSPDQVPTNLLLRIDVCWGVAIGLLLVDSIIAFDFATRHTMMSLKAGDPKRISRALSVLSGFLASSGGRARKRTESVIREARMLAEKVGTPREIGLAELAAGGGALLCGEYKRAAGLLLNAEKILLEKCTGVMWELTTCRSFLLSCLIYLGDLSEVNRRLPVMVSDALNRGNLLAATEARTRANFGWLALGEVDRAQREIDLALATWSHQGFHRQHYNALISQANIALYRRDPVSAWKLVEQNWSPLGRSLLLRIQVLRTESHFLRARCALAAAAHGLDPGRLLRVAEHDAAKIARERMPWIDPFADLIRAGVSSMRGDRQRAKPLLRVAADRFDAVDMSLYAAAARRRLGEISAGDEGARLVALADGVMKERLVHDPARLTEVLAPGIRHEA